ncbi:radical SAM protein [bacterium]|nr:radical SAM protein [bacterium]MCI0606309.1 radical SAM protein [bacterium]
MLVLLRRRFRAYARTAREARMVARALKSTTHPVLAHVVPIRRCNLSCTYCNEFDSFSKPVPIEEMLQRIDHLARLGTEAIHLSGGEPMLHPDLDAIIQRIADHGIFAGLLTNGYLLTVDRIKRFNKVGLDHLQISVDNVNPDDVSMKSLKVLDKKLQWLSTYAEFHVNINSVVGSSIKNPQDAVKVAHRAVELGLTSTVGIIHDGEGQLKPLQPEHLAAYQEAQSFGKQTFLNFAFYNQFQKNLTLGLPNEWKCRAGSRYLYICEDGLVHYCSQQRGFPAIPLEKYSLEDLKREYSTVKSCAPFCTVSCVHRVSLLDFVRENPREALTAFFPTQQMPAPVRMLAWLFMPGEQQNNRRILRKIASRILGVS